MAYLDRPGGLLRFLALAHAAAVLGLSRRPGGGVPERLAAAETAGVSLCGVSSGVVLLAAGRKGRVADHGVQGAAVGEQGLVVTFSL